MFSLTRFVRTFFFRMQLKLFENDIIHVHFGFARKIESYMRIRTVNIYIYFRQSRVSCREFQMENLELATGLN